MDSSDLRLQAGTDKAQSEESMGERILPPIYKSLPEVGQEANPVVVTWCEYRADGVRTTMGGVQAELKWLQPIGCKGDLKGSDKKRSFVKKCVIISAISKCATCISLI
jgi:hypothetical protein